MGKVDLAFDHITEKEKVSELSVVFYTDSFFYGLWDKDDFLVKTGYHPYDSLPNLCEIWKYYFPLKEAKVISAIKPFLHLPKKLVNPKKFDLYFKGLYNLELLEKVSPKVDAVPSQKINTLHYVQESPWQMIEAQKWNSSIRHISTALIAYLSKEPQDLIFYSAKDSLHIAYSNHEGFKFYNQFKCYYETDYLYFIQLILEEFNISEDLNKVVFSGDLNLDAKRIALLDSYHENIDYVYRQLKLKEDISYMPTHYYDLQLCKSCV